MKSYRRTPESKLPRTEKNVTVGTTAGGYLDAHSAAENKSSGLLKLTDKGTTLAESESRYD